MHIIKLNGGNKMITKENIWFLTLFSLILILGVYYVTMPSDFLKSITTSEEETEAVIEEVEEESPLSAMRVSLEEEREEKIEVLKEELTNTSLTTDEINNAYEQLKYLNELQGKEENLEKKIKKKYDLDCFIEIDNSDVNTICVSDEHTKELANNIMRLIQNEYTTRMNVTIKFQKSN
jgi:stage III sporulation protein AH